MELPGIKIVRLDAPFYFANAEYVRRVTYELCGLDVAILKCDAHSDDQIVAGPSGDASRATKYHSISPTAWTDVEVDPAVAFTDASSGSGNAAVPAASPVPQTQRISNGTGDSVLNVSNASAGGMTPRFLVFDCAAVCYVDVTGVETIEKMALECRAVGVELLFASCKGTDPCFFLATFNFSAAFEDLSPLLCSVKISFDSKRLKENFEKLDFFKVFFVLVQLQFVRRCSWVVSTGEWGPISCTWRSMMPCFSPRNKALKRYIFHVSELVHSFACRKPIIAGKKWVSNLVGTLFWSNFSKICSRWCRRSRRCIMSCENIYCIVPRRSVTLAPPP